MRACKSTRIRRSRADTGYGRLDGERDGTEGTCRRKLKQSFRPFTRVYRHNSLI